jgi:hypothetical protein
VLIRTPEGRDGGSPCRSQAWSARRIVCDLKPGEKVTIGDTYGLIRYGSRLDTYLPRAPRYSCCPASGPSAARRSLRSCRDEAPRQAAPLCQCACCRAR